MQCNICFNYFDDKGYIIQVDDKNISDIHTQNITRNYFQLLQRAITLSTILTEDNILCDYCSDLVLTELNKQIEKQEQITPTYIDFLDAGPKDVNITDDVMDDINMNEDEIDKLVIECDQLLKELSNVKKENDKLSYDSLQLDMLEEKVSNNINIHNYELNIIEDEIDSVNRQIEYTINIEEKLSLINVLNELYNIQKMDTYMSINGYRFGINKWDEYNASLEYILHLYQHICKYLKYNSNVYELDVSKRSFINRKKNVEYELFYKDDNTIELIKERVMSNGLIFFLECFEDLIRYVDEEYKFKVPFKIRGTKIGKDMNYYSIRYDKKNTNWYKACGYILINLKHLIALCSKN